MVVEHLLSKADPANPVMVSKPIANLTATCRSLRHKLWCPGCDNLHMPRSPLAGFTPIDGPHWEWDGNETSPTFSPSYLTWWTNSAGTPDATEHRCHSYIRAGQWEFLSDCTHPLAGQTVPLVPVPNWVLDLA